MLVGAPRARLRVPLAQSVETALTPGGAVRRSDGAELGIEVFGLEPGGRASLRVLVAVADSGQGDAAALRWRPYSDRRASAELVRGIGMGPIVPWHALLSLGSLKAGSWIVAVEVTDARGRTVRRERPILVETP